METAIDIRKKKSQKKGTAEYVTVGRASSPVTAMFALNLGCQERASRALGRMSARGSCVCKSGVAHIYGAYELSV